MDQLNGKGETSAPVFNIKAVVNQTGLNPATLRAWERRYGFPLPTRTPGGHRQYSQRDIDTLKWLIARQEEGVAISHAIDLWRSYVKRGQDPLQDSKAVVRDPAPPVSRSVAGGQIDQLRQRWLSACLAFDRQTAEQILASAFALFDPETVCLEVLQKGVAEVGQRWYEGEVTVQQEHFLSALSVQRLEMLIAAAPSPSRPERIIVASAPKDYHVFSPLLLTYLLRQRGWDVIYLGADVPADEMKSTMARVRPKLIVVSAQLLSTAATVKEIAELAGSYGVPLAFGGLIFNQIPSLRRLIPGHFLGESLEGAVQWIAESMSRKLPGTEVEEPGESYRQALARYRQRRALIESHVWDTFVANDLSTEKLSSINNEFAQTIEAALVLGDINLLQAKLAWVQHLLAGYRLSRPLIAEYVRIYHLTARVHLGKSAPIVVDWLSGLASDSGGE